MAGAPASASVTSDKGGSPASATQRRLGALIARVRAWWGTRTGFSVCLAFAIVAIQQAFYYFETFFLLRGVPSHDLSQGAAFFATSMHSVRLTGDIAWWNPIAGNGYAQYFQSFLSPLAPTSGHIVFIVWWQVIRGLSLLGVALPEYYQYLVVTYLVLPLLTYVSFGLFLTFLFESRAAICLVMLVYALSGIGLWNMAWFYMQEPFTLYFLLGSVLALLQAPRERTLLWVVAALLIQVASINYWTIYNSWFIGIVLVGYAATHPRQARRLISWLRSWGRSRRYLAWALGLGSLGVCLLWLTIIADATATGRAYVRASLGAAEYGADDAYARIHELRWYTLDLFNPTVASPPEPDNILHMTRYIGAGMVPLLVLAVLLRWRRRDLFLALTGLGVFVVCLGPPFVLLAWRLTPGMNRITHALYFYTHYWQLLLTLMSGAALERILRQRSAAMLWTTGRVMVAVAGLAGLALLSLSFLNDASEALLRELVLVLVSAVLMLQVTRSRSVAHQRLIAGAFLLLTLADLGEYFWKVSRRDHEFTALRWRLKDPLDAATQAALRKPWAQPDLQGKGFGAGVADSMPIVSDFWPTNNYVVPEVVQRVAEHAELRPLGWQDTLAFFPRCIVASIAEVGPKVLADPAVFDGAVVLQHQPQRACSASRDGAATNEAPFTFRAESWSYNAHAFTIQAPADGWLYVSQVYDSDWVVRVDGVKQQHLRANIVGMAVSVTAGRHQVSIDYRPLARRLYGPASASLELALIGLLALGRRAGGRRAARQPS